MSEHDDILDQIDEVLAGGDQAVGEDWSVSGDAMRSRPATEHDTPYGETSAREIHVTTSSIVARATRILADRERAVQKLALLTDSAYAAQMRITTGGDVRQLDLLSRLFAARGDTEATRRAAQLAYSTGGSELDYVLFDETGGYNPASDLWAAPSPSLRARVIEALGLTAILVRMVGVISQLLERFDPRRAARERRRHPAKTVTVTLTVDLTQFNAAMSRFGDAMSGVGMATSTMAGSYRRAMDRLYIADLVADQTHEALAWLDQHVDGIYADLRLDRADA